MLGEVGNNSQQRVFKIASTIKKVMSDEKEFRVAINDDGSSKKRRLRVLRSKSHIWDCDSASSNGVIEFNNRVGEMRRTETYNQGEL